MHHLKTMLTHKPYLLEIGSYVGLGTAFSAIVAALPMLFEKTETANELSPFEFLASVEDLREPLQDLLSKLKLNRWSQTQANNFARICDMLNVLAGYQVLVDRDKFVPLDTNYRVQYILHDLEQCYLVVVKQKFHLSVIGLEVCDILDKLKEATKNIKCNIELQIQYQSAR